MNKYKVLSNVGTVISTLGMGITVISACIDVDHSAPNAMSVMLVSMAIGIALFLIGYALCDFKSVEGHFLGALLVVGAWGYHNFHINTEFGKMCYRVVHKAGSYSDAYDMCYVTYVHKA